MTEIDLALRDDRFDQPLPSVPFGCGNDDAIEIIVTPLIERLRIAAPGILMDIVGVAEDVAGDWRQQDRCRHRRRLVATHPAIESRF
jgi:hypothetical protein